MDKIQDPFFYTQLECPVCKTLNEYTNIKMGSYSESGRDTDFCPTGCVWQNPAFQRYDPLLFFMATCRKCFYTRELNNAYKNWQKDSTFKMYRLKNIQEKHLNEYMKEGGILKLLGEHIDQNKYPFESAVIRLLLGIFDEELLERPSKLDLGRYFLRIGWLFRGENGQIDGESSIVSGFFLKLKGSVKKANQFLPDYDDRIKSLKRLIEHDYTLIFNDVSKAGDYKRQIQQAISEVSSSLEPLINAGGKLEEVFSEAEKALAGANEVRNETFFGFPSFYDFLYKAKELWDEVPLSEREALMKAAEYYRQAYETGDKIGQGIGQVQAAYLIAELSRRIGNHEDADSYFNQMIRLSRDIIHSQKEDKSTIKFTKKLLEMAMDQARLNRRVSEGAAK
jgi:tetratricopeptide (TPR) repeat protein